MNYSSNERGEGILTLTPEEKIAFESGQSVRRISGDRLGIFTITAKLTRPNSRAKRFPVESYGEGYKPDPNPVSASVKLMEDRQKYMRNEAEKLLVQYDFGSDTFEDNDGWEWDSQEPNVISCVIYLRENGTSEVTTRFRFKVDFTGDKPLAEVY